MRRSVVSSHLTKGTPESNVEKNELGGPRDQRVGIDARKTGKSWSERFEVFMGFKMQDVASWSSFINLLHRPSHPASLAAIRISYGIVMMFDLVIERGMSNAIELWDDRCLMPLVHGMPALPPEWMMILYVIMFLGLLGMTLGLGYRLACCMFLLPYTYTYLLDRMNWSNHSSYFLLIGFVLAISDANRYWSLDNIVSQRQIGSHVPLWSYYILRLQVFLLYFISGLKKLHPDWMTISPRQMGHRRAFAPFRLFLSAFAIDVYFVPWSGLLIDLFMGFLLFADATRPFGLFIGISFHLMNMFLFERLGMFPQVSIITLFAFCRTDWPLQFLATWSRSWSSNANTARLSANAHCLYQKDELGKEVDEQIYKGAGNRKNLRDMHTRPRLYHKLLAVFVVVYTAQQCLTPYSHSLTPGYAGWKPGMTGYSWNMMITYQKMLSSQIKYVDKHTGQFGYFNHETFKMASGKWHFHGDMMKQFASCVTRRLQRDFNISVAELYLDIWTRKNRRCFQRCVRPDVDILKAPWSVFRRTPWIVPIIDNLTLRVVDITQRNDEVQNWGNFTRIQFLTDYPGSHVFHFLRRDVARVNVTVVEGEIMVTVGKRSVNLTAGETQHELPVGQYHKVTVVSPQPAVFHYMYEDRRLRHLDDEATKLSRYLQTQQGVYDEKDLDIQTMQPEWKDDDETLRVKSWLMERRGITLWEYTKMYMKGLGNKWVKSFVGVVAAARSIWTGDKMADTMSEMWETTRSIQESEFMDETQAHSLI